MDWPGKENGIILFDGYCNFCSGSVQFIIQRDPSKVYRFAASQSDAGQRLQKIHGMDELAEHSLILISNGIIYKKSGAALRISRRLRGIWPVFYGLIIIPRAFRDIIYDLIARNRYRIYGMRDECFLPGPVMKDRFL